jgi:murein L,D-transpeptidase YafK
MHTAWREPIGASPDERAQRAVEARTPVVKGLFAAAGVRFPPEQMLFRAFKQEHELEVWAGAEAGGPLTRIAVYEICGLSGDLGPKRREGDGQVPEGFYKIHYLWPNSSYFHLEMKVGYPNDLDRHLSEKVPEGPGGDIMIHGTCASIGCLAVSDERVEELWTMASAVHVGERRVHVHIFPARDMAALLRDPAYAPHHRFWANLQEGYERFEKDHRLFRVTADWHARYLFD